MARTGGAGGAAPAPAAAPHGGTVNAHGRQTRCVVLRRPMRDVAAELPRAVETAALPAALAADEVELDMRAIAVNFADSLVLRGLYQIRPPMPFTPGFDFSGVVTRVGKGVTRFRPGDRVCGGCISAADHALGRGGGVARGGWSEATVQLDKHLRRVPDHLTHAQASMLATTFTTAHYALLHEARLAPGEVVLVHAAAGAIGLAACQVAKARGATVVATAGSDAKLRVTRMRGGADICVNYRDPSWATLVREALGGRAVDVVFDPVGLPQTSTKLMGYHSRLLVVGFAGWNSDPAGQSGGRAQQQQQQQSRPGPPGELPGPGHLPALALSRILVKHCSVIGVYLFAFADAEPEVAERVWTEVHDHLESGAYNPVVGTALHGGLEAIPRALELTMSREAFGKVVVSMDSRDDAATAVKRPAARL